MTRQEANRLILKRISDEIERNPHVRFHQILRNLNVIEEFRDEFGIPKWWLNEFHAEPDLILNRMREATNCLADYADLISDDFQSTFSTIDDNTLTNMLGMPGDFESLTKIIQDYIPDAKIEYVKTNQLGKDADYDIYLIKKVN